MTFNEVCSFMTVILQIVSISVTIIIAIIYNKKK